VNIKFFDYFTITGSIHRFIASNIKFNVCDCYWVNNEQVRLW